jgi:prophage antirepressor-like protein
LWALGTVLGRSNTPALQSMAGWLFEQALPAILETTSPRAWAFTLIGIHEYLRRFDGDRRASQVRDELAGRLLALYQTAARMSGAGMKRVELLQRRAAAGHADVRPMDSRTRP